MKTARVILLLSIPVLLFTGCHINKSFWIKDGEKSHGSKKTINGSIFIGENSEVTGNCGTINGRIYVGSYSKVRDLGTINGNIKVGNEAVVRGDIKLINGNLHCDHGVKVTGDIETVNGEIKLEGALVEDDLSTYNGNIKLYEKTIISGGVIIKERYGNTPDYHDLYIEIDDSIVEGDIVNEDYDTDVTVYLANGGQVKGTVKGVKVVER